MPHGALGELLPTLEALRSTDTRVVLGLRDIVDAPEIVRRRWQVEGAYDALDRYYDLVLVYGNQDVYDVAVNYDMCPAVADRLHYCGYVCAPDEAQQTRRVRTRCLNGSKAERLIVATAGGGADAYPLMEALLRAMPAITAEAPAALTIITGPFMPDDMRRALQVQANGSGVKIRTSVQDVLSYIAAADVVVGMAGYNTTVEVLRMATPAVLVPRAGPSAEQRTRARLFDERRLGRDGRTRGARAGHAGQARPRSPRPGPPGRRPRPRPPGPRRRREPSGLRARPAGRLMRPGSFDPAPLCQPTTAQELRTALRSPSTHRVLHETVERLLPARSASAALRLAAGEVQAGPQADPHLRPHGRRIARSTAHRHLVRAGVRRGRPRRG